jgi:NAD(P)-dependent dehydrogenase (short-subunit alcohol dehydrogenase family)
MNVVVIGGTGTIGMAVVARLQRGHDVTIASRHTPHARVDITDPDSIRALFESIPQPDAVVCAAGAVVFKPFDELRDEDYAFGAANKLMGQANIVRMGHRYLSEGGSFTLTSGKLGRQPTSGTCSIALINSGIEGFVRAAAVELPRGIRVNAVSPEWTKESLALYGMDPSFGVPVATVAEAYVLAIEGSMTGTVIDVGWRYDAEHDYVAADELPVLAAVLS